MIDREILQEVLGEALGKGGDFADIYVELRKITGIGCEGGKIERVHTGVENGAGIRVLSGESTAYAYTNDLTRSGLLAAAQVVSHAASGSARDLNIDLRALSSPVEFSFGERPDQVSTERKVDAVLAADRAARAVDGKHIKQVLVGYGDLVQHVIMANSLGELVEDERIRTRLLVQVVAGDHSSIQTGYEAVGSVSGFDLLERFRPEDTARAAACRAVKMLEARPAPVGNMPVVLAGEAGGTMVHEACGHGLEADLAQKGISVYGDKRGQLVASPEITVVDDATGRFAALIRLVEVLSSRFSPYTGTRPRFEDTLDAHWMVEPSNRPDQS